MTTNFAAAIGSQVVDRDLFALGDVSQSVNSVPSDEFVPILLCVVVASVVDTTGFEEYSSADPVVLDGETVGPNDTKRLLNNVFIWKAVVKRQERLSLQLVKRINLLGYMRLQPFSALLTCRYRDGWSFL